MFSTGLIALDTFKFCKSQTCQTPNSGNDNEFLLKTGNFNIGSLLFLHEGSVDSLHPDGPLTGLYPRVTNFQIGKIAYSYTSIVYKVSVGFDPDSNVSYAS